MKRGVLIVLAVAGMLLAACGDDEETTVTETVTEEATTGAETTGTGVETTAATGPSGAVTSTGVGEVQQGMSLAEVEALFGAPAKTQTGPGCELAGPQAPEVTSATYELGDGETLILSFEKPAEVLNSYRTSSATLTTEKGDKIGDPFSSLQANWGSQLKPVQLGAKATPKAGFWQVGKPGGLSGLLFDIRGGKITVITGGEIQFCE